MLMLLFRREGGGRAGPLWSLQEGEGSRPGDLQTVRGHQAVQRPLLLSLQVCQLCGDPGVLSLLQTFRHQVAPGLHLLWGPLTTVLLQAVSGESRVLLLSLVPYLTENFAECLHHEGAEDRAVLHL